MENEACFSDKGTELYSILSSGNRDFLLSPSGDQVSIKEVEGNTIGLYFGANWFPKCSNFNQILASVYHQLKEENSKFEIIFVSSDEDQSSFDEFYATMPWLAIPFWDLNSKKMLTQRFNIEGIPSLIILSSNGELVHQDGVELVYRYGVRAFPFTQERLKVLEGEEKAKHASQTLENLLFSEGRDYVMSHDDDNSKVHVSPIEIATRFPFFPLLSEKILLKRFCEKTPRISMSENPSDSAIYIISSGNEDGSERPRLEIVKEEAVKEADKTKKNDNDVIVVNSSLEGPEATPKVTKKRKKRKIKRKGSNVGAVDSVIGVRVEEDIAGVADTTVTEVNGVPDNTVMRKLLRGPRYFDPGEKGSSACINCGDEGHTTFSCTMAKKKRPCFVCGKFGHKPWHCSQGQDCFICNRKGHIAKNCPDRGDHAQESTLCLRCGDLGHDMVSCENDYAPGDLKEIQCYMCKNHGHLCCVDFVVDGPKVVFCYNCAQPGHMGPECWKLLGTNNELVDAGPSALCFKCGEEGHFAGECTKKLKRRKWMGRSATRHKRKGRRKQKSAVSGSAPAAVGRSCKEKKRRPCHNDRSNMSTNQSRKEGSSTVDDPDGLPIKDKISNIQNSASTPTAQRSVNAYLPNNSSMGTPISTPLTSSYHSRQHHPDGLPIKNKISNNQNSASTPTAQRSVNIYLPNNASMGTPISTPLTSSYHSGQHHPDGLPIKNKISNNRNSASTPTAQRSVNVYLPNNSSMGTRISTPSASSYPSRQHHHHHHQQQQQQQQQQHSYTPTSSYPNPQYNYNLNTSYHTQQFNYTPSNYHNQHFNHTPPSSFRNQHFSHTPPSSFHNQHFNHTPPSSFHNQHFSHTPPSSFHSQHFSDTPRSSFHSQHFSHTPPSNFHNSHFSDTPPSSYRNQHFGHTSPSSYRNQHFGYTPPSSYDSQQYSTNPNSTYYNQLAYFPRPS